MAEGVFSLAVLVLSQACRHVVVELNLSKGWDAWWATGSTRFAASSLADEGDAGEGFLEGEGPLGVLMRQSIELFLVALHLLDEVDEVTRLLELLQVLRVNHVAELVLNADDQLDNVERVQAVVAEGRVERDRGLARRAEVILRDRDDILLDLVVGLQDESVLRRVDLSFPELEVALSCLFTLGGAGNKSILVQTQLLEVAHALRGHEHSGLRPRHHHHGRAVPLLHCSKSETAQHFYFFSVVRK
jgi:hypothetical protein